MKKIIKKRTKKVVKKEIEPVCEDVCCGKKSFKKCNCHLICFLILLALVGVGFYKFGVVATVNGEPIYRWSYITELQKQDKQTVLNQMIQDALITGEAKNKGVVIDQKAVDEAISKIEEQIKAQGMTLDDAMKAQGITKEELIAQIRTQKIAEALASPSAEVTKEQIDAFLKENKSYLPKGKMDSELQALAKEQLETQAKNASLSTWYSNLKSSAKIIYK